MSFSLASIGFMRYFLILFSSSGVNSPSMRKVWPEEIEHFVSGFSSPTHCLALSALWSYCPGRYSLDTVIPFTEGRSSRISSTIGSEKIVLRAFSSTFSLILKTS